MTIERIMRKPETCKTTGISASNLYKLISEGKFPKPIKLGERASGWLESEVQTWIQKQVKKSRQGDDL